MYIWTNDEISLFDTSDQKWKIHLLTWEQETLSEWKRNERGEETSGKERMENLKLEDVGMKQIEENAYSPSSTSSRSIEEVHPYNFRKSKQIQRHQVILDILYPK